MISGEQEHRFLGSGVEAPPTFAALSSQGSGAYTGLETFDNPGCTLVHYTSDEVVAKCPVTGQPDYYTCKITLKDSPKLIESKSLKIWFNNLHENTMSGNAPGLFCETLAVFIRDQVIEVTGSEEENTRVVLTQKSRGGISIEAVA
jgi:NADPH-dependent 7-cyano-7-deazaguanine reductase QueF